MFCLCSFWVPVFLPSHSPHRSLISLGLRPLPFCDPIIVAKQWESSDGLHLRFSTSLHNQPTLWRFPFDCYRSCWASDAPQVPPICTRFVNHWLWPSQNGYKRLPLIGGGVDGYQEGNHNATSQHNHSGTAVLC